MDTVFELARWVSAAAFLVFGLACLTTRHMVEEFRRYGLARFRVLVGSLEVLGALGLVAGVVWPAVHLLAALGLSLLMALGVATRIRIRDTVVQSLPAAALLLVNAFLVVHPLTRAPST